MSEPTRPIHPSTPEPDLTHIDDLCTWEGPDVDPLVGCIEPGVRVVGSELLCPHHIAATLRERVRRLEREQR